MRKRIVLLAVVGLVLAGCSGTPDYKALVAERFGECLEALNVPADQLTQAGNRVFVPLREGVMLEWTVTTGNGGDTLTIPDSTTAAELSTVGC